jgi:hypothetical protein
MEQYIRYTATSVELGGEGESSWCQLAILWATWVIRLAGEAAQVQTLGNRQYLNNFRDDAMATARKAAKTNWKDIGDLRLPNSTSQIGRAANQFKKRLGSPQGIIAFYNPDGSKARVDKSLKALRRDWQQIK